MSQARHGQRIATRLRRTTGVHDVRWTASTRSLAVRHDRGLSLDELLQQVPHDDASAPPRQRSAPWWRQALVPAAALSAGLAGVAPISSLAIASCAIPIARRALTTARRRRLSIDVLDATAVTLLLGTGDVLAAGVSVALIESGERLRAHAAGRARTAFRRWMIADDRGVRVLRSGTEPRVPVESVAVGDRAVVYAGEALPVDGRVVSGAGSVDNRTWTGEPYPVPVEPGDDVLAGATVVDGRLVVEIAATGERTRAGRLAAAIEDALAANTPTTDTARRIADRFVLPMLLSGGLALAVTGDIGRVVSMLIVDFGTGIRVAVPTAYLATMIAAARRDVLFKNGRAIETLASVDTIVFDKTGTLTAGRPTVVGIDPANGHDAAALLRLAGAAEGHLPHPIARAIRHYARSCGLELPAPAAVRVAPGGGVEAEVERHVVHVGRWTYLRRAGVRLPAAPPNELSMAHVAIDHRFAGTVRVQDGLRSEARAVVDELRAHGVNQLWLATGDREAVAKRVAHSLGLDGVHAHLMPEEKAQLVRRMRDEGRRVAVVGDGINDAAAMAEADLGIAVARGAYMARESASIVLGAEDLALLVDAIDMARFTMRLVRQDIAFVSVPNGVALAAATAGALPPLAATVVNNGSTLLAGANSLRPLRLRRSERARSAAAWREG